MKWLKRIGLWLLLGFVLFIVALNIWGAATQGTITPDPQAARDPMANRVVLVSGATGSVGDSLLKAVLDAPEVAKIHVITRRSSPRIDEGVAAGKVELHLLQDFTDYSDIAVELAEVNTVMWALGTSSVGMDPDTYTRIHVDFPVAFVTQWLAARAAAPMAFHYVTGMGTGEDESARWAQDKGRAERLVAELAEGTGLRTFGHHSGYIRPPADRASWGAYGIELLVRPGKLVIVGPDLGRAMLEISARTGELPNGTTIDNADALAYAKLYREADPAD